MKKVVIDCDPGADDASALFIIAKAHKCDLVQLLAITTTHGNSSLDNVIINTARTLTAAGLNQIPIFKGCHSAIVDPVVNDELFNGVDGFGDAEHEEEPDLSYVDHEEHAVNALVRLVKENPGEICLIALGPLTNVAMAMRMDDQFASNLAELYIMGGNTEGLGNIAVAAEFNFYSDPESAYIVLNNTRCPTYMACWELCFRRTRIDWDWRLNEYGEADSPQSRLMNRIDERNITRRPYDFFIVCDQLIVAAAIDPRSVVRQSTLYATVELTGRHTRGQMVVDYAGLLKKEPNVHLIDEIDIDLVKRMMLWSVDHPNADYDIPTVYQ